MAGISNYRPEIDGLRSVAILPVLLSHAGFLWAQGGFIGVDIFFVISGFLITRIIATEIAEGSFSIVRFYERRARRILPALFLVTVACVLPAWWLMLPDAFEEFGNSLVAVPLFVSNILFWMESGYFATESGLKPLIHTWSLAVEEQYYIVFPLLALLVLPRGRRAFIAVLAVIACLSLAVAEWTSARAPDASFFLPHTRVWELFAGSIAAMLILRQKPLPLIARQALSLAGGAAIVWALATFTAETIHPGLVTALPVVGTALVLLFAERDTLVGKLLALPPLVWVGLISYSLYLWHQPVFAFTRMALGEAGPRDLVVPALLCFPLAWASWRFVETPFRDRSRVRRPRLVASVGVFTAVPLCLGALIVATHGMPGRYGDAFSAGLWATEGQKRRDGIAMGRCHFNTDSGDIDDFLERWDCLPEAGPRILFVGDSHAGDKAWAARLAGLPIGQLTAGGCAVSLADRSRSKQPHCLRLFSHARQLVRDGKVDALVLAQRFRAASSARQEATRIVANWSGLGVPVALFTPMPDFGDIRRKWTDMRLGKSGEQALAYEAEPYDTLLAAMMSSKRLRKSGFRLLDTRALFCGDAGGPCVPLRDGEPLLLDYSHLTSDGAEVFGSNLAKDDRWRKWVRGIERGAGSAAIR